MRDSYDCLIVCGSPAFEPHSFNVPKASFNHVIACDKGAEYCLLLGLSPDVVIGDLDSLSPNCLEKIKACHIPTKSYPVRKDETDYHLALTYAEKNAWKTVLVIGASGGRLSHELGFLGASALHPELAIDFWFRGGYGYVLSAMFREKIVLSKQDAYLSIFSLSEKTTLSTSGLLWDLQEEYLPVLSDRGVSNEWARDTATISLTAGTALVIVENK